MFLHIQFRSVYFVLFCTFILLLLGFTKETNDVHMVSNSSQNTLDIPLSALSGEWHWDDLSFLTNRVRNIVLDNEPVQSAFEKVILASTNDVLLYELPPEDTEKCVTVTFKDTPSGIPLGLALHILATLSKYHVTVLHSQTLLVFEPDTMCYENRYIPATTIQKMIQVSQLKDDEVSLDEWFEGRGIRMTNGAKATFDPRYQCITMQNYKHELSLMEALLTLEERQIQKNDKLLLTK